jgi:hypothetical protein
MALSPEMTKHMSNVFEKLGPDIIDSTEGIVRMGFDTLQLMLQRLFYNEKIAMDAEKEQERLKQLQKQQADDASEKEKRDYKAQKDSSKSGLVGVFQGGSRTRRHRTRHKPTRNKRVNPPRGSK